MKKLLFRTSRPVGWIINPLIFLLGFSFSGANISILSLTQIFMLSFPHCLFLYGINDVYDYESDKLNPRKDSFEGVVLKPKNHDLVKKASYIIILLLFFTSIMTSNFTNMLGTIILVFFSYFYSAPPLRFKTKPFLDSLSNGLIYFLAPFIIGYSYNGSIFEIPYNIYVIGLSVMGVHVFSTIMDYSIDKKMGDKTISVFIGKRLSAILSTILFGLTLILADLSTPILNYYLIFSIMLSLIIFIHPSEELASKFFKLYYIGFLLASLTYIITCSGAFFHGLVFLHSLIHSLGITRLSAAISPK